MGEFEEQDAAVVQAWHERDVEDAEHHTHRLAERLDENAGRTAKLSMPSCTGLTLHWIGE